LEHLMPLPWIPSFLLLSSAWPSPHALSGDIHLFVKPTHLSPQVKIILGTLDPVDQPAISHSTPHKPGAPTSCTPHFVPVSRVNIQHHGWLCVAPFPILLPDPHIPRRASAPSGTHSTATTLYPQATYNPEVQGHPQKAIRFGKPVHSLVTPAPAALESWGCL
jgi:hypothetical protein